jgi:hypothetical protein
MSERSSETENFDDRAARVLDALDDESDAAHDADSGQDETGDTTPAASPPSDGKQTAKPEATAAAIAPPVSWSSEDKAAFARLPREAQEVIARRESERDRFLSQRTQAVAQKERALEEQRRSYAQHLEAFIEQAKNFDPILGEGAQTDWTKLARENPSAYVQKMAAFQQRVQQLRSAHQERQRIADETNRVVATRELEQLGAKVPEIRDAMQRQALMRELGTFLGESGFSPQEVGGLTDHRAYLIALDAMRYRKLMKGQKETAAKKVVSASKVQRPGPALDGEPASSRLTQLKRAARTTGKLDDRAAYVLAALREV